MTEVIHSRTDGGILEVTLDRPKANAIDLSTSRQMGDVFQSFRDDAALRVCILRTAGEKFFYEDGLFKTVVFAELGVLIIFFIFGFLSEKWASAKLPGMYFTKTSQQRVMMSRKLNFQIE